MSNGTPYVVGIDLGTTNCAIAYVDTEPDPENPDVVGDVETFEIEQLVRSGATKGRIQLPSALYLPGDEVSEKAMALPFEGPDEGTIHGQFALDQGAKIPHRVVSSSKPWLCHSGVDRRGPILPWGSDGEEVDKISPQEAARRLMLYLRSAWDATMAEDEPDYELAKQEIYLTVPASFDPEARDLTVEAARKAGLTKVTLLEEPQAAFYSWIEQQADGWREQLAVGDTVLVFDVGGGTTDLTLISASEEGGNLVLERIAVGDHLLLGGDNMDLALAHVAANKLGGKLDAWQSRALWLAARKAKEALLSDPEKDQADVVILGRSSKLIGGSQKTQLTRADVDAVVINGFFPDCKAEDRPLKRRGAGLSELGLPFEADPGITKHVAAFLGRQQGDGEPVFPSAVLFNGGVFKGPTVRDRAVEVLNGWLKTAGRDALKPLAGEDLDLGVARGAAYYGLVRRGRGVRIRGGTARTYYVGIESTMPAIPGMPPPLKALCVAPFGMEEGTSADVSEREFSLLVGEQAEFRFLGSSTRKEDQPGEMLDRWDEDELEELSPLQVTLEAGEGHEGGATVPVTLSSAVTEIGTLEVHCVSRDGERFKLEWNVREGDGDGDSE